MVQNLNSAPARSVFAPESGDQTSKKITKKCFAADHHHQSKTSQTDRIAYSSKWMPLVCRHYDWWCCGSSPTSKIGFAGLLCAHWKRTGSQFPVLLEIKNKLPITISVSCQYNAKAFKTHLGIAWTDTVIAETTLAKDLISQGIFHNSDFN